MFLQKLSLTDFKNYKEALFNFNEGINCIIGDNGVGKTNLLDAIYYLSFTKSAINSQDSQNVKKGAPLAVVTGFFQKKSREVKIVCALKERGKKVFKVDGEELDKLSNHIGQFPVVLISPDDTSILREGSEVRRKFVDGCISQNSQAYLNNLISYNQLLKQRNNLLKNWPEGKPPDTDLFDSYDQKLFGYGKLIFDERKQFTEDFIPYFEKHYQFISNEKEQVNIVYSSQMSKGSFEEEFRNALKKDLILQRTTMGIHKDDFLIQMDDQPVKKFASQGQQKSAIIALKTAQYELLKSQIGFPPIFLLDDIFDKLDDLRIQKLTELISGELFGQIFVTDARPERSREFFKKSEREVAFYQINDGSLLAEKVQTA